MYTMHSTPSVAFRTPFVGVMPAIPVARLTVTIVLPVVPVVRLDFCGHCSVISPVVRLGFGSYSRFGFCHKCLHQLCRRPSHDLHSAQGAGDVTVDTAATSTTATAATAATSTARSSLPHALSAHARTVCPSSEFGASHEYLRPRFVDAVLAPVRHLLLVVAEVCLRLSFDFGGPWRVALLAFGLLLVLLILLLVLLLLVLVLLVLLLLVLLLLLLLAWRLIRDC